MRGRIVFLGVSMLTLLIFMTGCFSSNPADIEAFIKPTRVNTSTDSYILQPPDRVEIHCSKVPELHLQTQQIRPDGKVAFEGLGEIHAAGKTPKELSSVIHEKILMLYALTGQHPIDVRVTAFRSKVYYVLGQFFFPGAKVFTGRDTVLRAVADARPTTLAWLERVQVIRPSAEEGFRPRIFEVNFDKMSAHGDTTKNVLLEEGDIVYLPPTVLAAIGLKVEELVRPIGRAFSTVNIVQGPPSLRD